MLVMMSEEDSWWYANTTVTDAVCFHVFLLLFVDYSCTKTNS